MDLGLQSVLFVLVVVDEPLGETGTSSSVLEQDETDLSLPSDLPFESSFGFKYIYIMNKNIKKALRIAYTLRREAIAQQQNEMFRGGLKQQLKRVLALVETKKNRDFGLIGSYLYDSIREIEPPSLEGYRYAYPRF